MLVSYKKVNFSRGEIMNVPFKKMHGAGNDFIVIKNEDFPYEEQFSEFAKQSCHRHFGIGADGIMVVGASSIADVKMLYFNSDGSSGNMCGNGIRCFSKFAYDEGIVRTSDFSVETLAGVLLVETKVEDCKVKTVKVNMGKLSYKPEEIPVLTAEESYINKTLEIEGKSFVITTVLMGVPHTVIFSEDISLETVLKYGPMIEKHKLFPKGTNVNFAQIVDRGHINVRTWERGAGYTLACGTGVTSVCAVAYDLGLVEDSVEVTIDGGGLKITIEADGDIYMEGPAEDICKGIFFMKK